jgi:CRP/FNR family transcriptional regulator
VIILNLIDLIKKEFDTEKMDKIFLKKGDVYKKNTDEIKGITYLIFGKLKVVKYLPSGKELIVRYIDKNDIFAETLIFSVSNYPAYIIADLDSEIVEISKEKILGHLLDISFTTEYIKSISDKIKVLTDKIELLSFENTKKKLAYYFLNLYEAQKSNFISINNSKAEIARIFGSTRENISRNISLLEKDNIIKIINNRKIELKSIDILEKILLS